MKVFGQIALFVLLHTPQTRTQLHQHSISFHSLLAAVFFSKGHEEERSVNANANGIGRVEKKVRQGGLNSLSS